MAQIRNTMNLIIYVSKKLGKKSNVSYAHDSNGKWSSANEEANAIAVLRHFHVLYSCIWKFSFEVNSDCPLPSITTSVFRKHETFVCLSSDKIPLIFFRYSLIKLAVPLCQLLNIALIAGEFPTLPKKSIVLGVPKKTSPSVRLRLVRH